MSAAAAFGSSAEDDSAFMQRALALAHHGWGQTAPNPMVGAVVVATDSASGDIARTAGRASAADVPGTIIGEGYHARYGEAHAEVNALNDAGSRARGATLYVTLEPCAHWGKTPPCTDAIITAGITRVVAAVRDPSAIARGGVERLRAAGLQVDLDVERAATLELNAPFFNAQASDRPWVTLKLAMSADGAIADASRRPRWITSPASRREVHRLRANADAIAVGIGTVLADDPMLTVRDALPPRVAPRRVVFDSTLRTPLSAALVRTARDVPTIVIASSLNGSTTSAAPSVLDASIVARQRALEDAGVAVLFAATTADALVQLRTLGIRALFVEGGAGLAGRLLREDLVDRLVIFQSSIELGAGALPAFAEAPAGFAASLEHLPIVERATPGGDVMTVYALHSIPCSPD